MSSPSYAHKTASILHNFATILPSVYGLILALSTAMGIFVALLGIYIATWHQGGPRGGRLGSPSRGIVMVLIGSLMSIMPYTVTSSTEAFLNTKPQVPTASYHQYTAAGGGGGTSASVSHTKTTIVNSILELLAVMGYWWMYHGYYLLYRSSREDKAQSEDVQKGWTRLIAGIIAANALFVLNLITNWLGIHNPL